MNIPNAGISNSHTCSPPPSQPPGFEHGVQVLRLAHQALYWLSSIPAPTLAFPSSQKGGLPGAHLAAGVLLSEDEGAVELPLQGGVDCDLHRPVFELYNEGLLQSWLWEPLFPLRQLQVGDSPTATSSLPSSPAEGLTYCFQRCQPQVPHQVEAGLLVGGQLHVADDGDNVRVAVILEKSCWG